MSPPPRRSSTERSLSSSVWLGQSWRSSSFSTVYTRGRRRRTGRHGARRRPPGCPPSTLERRAHRVHAEATRSWRCRRRWISAMVARADLGAPEDEHREVCRGHRLRNVSREEGDHLLGVLGRELVNRQLERRLVDDLVPLCLHETRAGSPTAPSRPPSGCPGSTRSPWAFQTPLAIIAATICFASAESIPGMRSYWSALSLRSCEAWISVASRVVRRQVALDDPAGGTVKSCSAVEKTVGTVSSPGASNGGRWSVARPDRLDGIAGVLPGLPQVVTRSGRRWTSRSPPAGTGLEPGGRDQVRPQPPAGPGRVRGQRRVGHEPALVAGALRRGRGHERSRARRSG